MPTIGSHRAKPASTTVSTDSVTMLLAQFAVQLENSQLNARAALELNREVQKARLAEQSAQLAAAADLGAVVDKHKKTIAERMRKRFPALSGKEDKVVERGAKLLRADSRSALAKYAALPMSVTNNAVAVDLPTTAELIAAVNQLATCTQEAFQLVIEAAQTPGEPGKKYV